MVTNRVDLWIAIIISSVAYAVLKSVLLMIFHKLKLSNIFGFIWTSLIIYCGGKPNKTSIDTRKTYKAVIFISLLGGAIIWMAYRSYLTAELSVILKKYPFNDLESLSKSNWRYLNSFNFKSMLAWQFHLFSTG